MVDRLESIVSVARLNISFARLHTSISPALQLYQKYVTSFETTQINLKGVPTEIKDVKEKETLSSEIYW